MDRETAVLVFFLLAADEKKKDFKTIFTPEILVLMFSFLVYY